MIPSTSRKRSEEPNQKIPSGKIFTQNLYQSNADVLTVLFCFRTRTYYAIRHRAIWREWKVTLCGQKPCHKSQESQSEAPSVFRAHANWRENSWGAGSTGSKKTGLAKSDIFYLENKKHSVEDFRPNSFCATSSKALKQSAFKKDLNQLNFLVSLSFISNTKTGCWKILGLTLFSSTLLKALKQGALKKFCALFFFAWSSFI